MTSSSSLYGTPPNQDVSSTNSTSLYGEAGTPIPDSSGNLIVRGDLYVLSGNILTTATTGNIFPTNATTINLGNAATTINIGAATGSTNINNTLYAPGADFGNITIGITTDNTISTTTGNLVLDSATNLVQVNSLLEVNGTISTTDIQAAVGGAAPSGGLNLYSNNTVSAIHLWDDYVQISSGTIPGADWSFNQDGTTTFPGYVFPYLDGSANQVLTTNGSGILSFTDVQSLDTNYTIDASATSGGANFNLQGSDATTDTIKFAEGTGISVVRTNANVITFTNTGVLNSYNIDASATSGGANLNLTDGITTDSVKFASGTNTTVVRTDANTMTFNSVDTTYNIDSASTSGGVNLNLTGSDSSTDTVKFTSGTGISISSSGPTAMTITNTGILDPYDIDATATSGGANLNLNSALGTDTVKFADSTHITATRTGAGQITLGSDATNANTASTIVARDASGNFSAGTITADLIGNATSATTATTATTATQVSNSLTAGTHLSGGPFNGSSAVTLTTDATSSNTASTIVARDASGEFSASGATLSNISVGVVDANTIGGATNINLLSSATGYVNIDSGTSSPTVITRNTAGVSSNVRSLALAVQSSGTPTVGFGNSLEFQLETAPGNTEQAGYISVTSTDITPGSEDFKMSFGLMEAGGAFTEKVRIESQGNMYLDGRLYAPSAQLDNVTIALDSTQSVSTSTGNLVLQTEAGVNAGHITLSPGAFTSTGSSISGTTLTIGTLATGTIAVGQSLVGTGVVNTTTITANISGSGSGSTWTVSISQTVASTAINGAGNITADPISHGNVAFTLANGGNVTNTRNYTTGRIRNSTDISGGYIWALNSALGTQPFRGVSVDNSTDTSINAGYVARNYSGTAANRSRIIFERARGTAAAPTAVQAGDFIGSIEATGCNAAGVFINDAVQTGATTATLPGFMNFSAAETWSTGSGSGPFFGTQFGLTLAPTATAIQSAANLVPVITASPQSFASRSDSFTWAGGKSATAFSAITSSISGTTLTIGTVSTGTVQVGQFIQNTTNSVLFGTYIVKNLTGSGSGSTWEVSQTQTVTSSTFTGVSGQMYLNSNGNLDVFGNSRTNGTILGYNAGTAYASISSTSAQFTSTGLNTFTRQGTVNTTQPGLVVRYERSDTPGPNNGDGVDFRLGVGGTSTNTNIARFDASYDGASGNLLHTVGISVSTDSFGTDTDSIYRGKADKTIIRATPAGTTGTAADVLTIEQAKITAAAPIAFPAYTAAAANAITGAVGWQIAITNSGGGGNPNGMMAFWDTTNARWSYIHDNSAV